MEINKNMGKKALALLLCALMIIGFMPIKAHAAVISGDGYSYDDVTDILTISSNAIVNNWDNYEFVDYTQVKHLVIEDSVTNITSYAFYAWDTTSLESVIIGSGVTNIDGGAFTNNANLKSACFTGMNAPTFGAIAFDGCASSFSVYYPAGGKGYTSLGYTAQSPYGANVSVNGYIVITFNQQMNTSVNGTVTLGAATLDSTKGSWSGNTFTIPYSGLEFGTSYQVSTSGFKNASNAEASTPSYSFTTASTSSPYITNMSNITSDNINGNIELTFSEAMDTNSGTVSLDGGSTYLSGGSWDVDAIKYTIPYSNLSYFTTYSVVLYGFKDAGGSAMPFDDSYSITMGGDPDGYNCDLSYGNISVSSGTLTYYTDLDTSTSISYDTSKNIVIKQSNRSSATANTITVSDSTAKITLYGVNISGGTPLSITSTSAVDLTVMNSNTLTGGTNCAGIFVKNNSSLHILAASTGSLTANGSGHAAGIGGQGTLTAESVDCYNGTITISGGTITANGGGDEGSGIGCSNYNNAGNITIDGGTVTATGGGALGGAGIGGAYDGEYKGGTYNIVIRGSANVTANAGAASSAIGGGRLGGENNGVITIEGTPTVTANGDGYGAAIGGGESTSGGTINISGGTVNAYGSYDNGGGAGIGGGTNRSGGTINISGGNITARGTGSGAAIGGGNFGNGGTINISGGTVTVPDSNFQGAGIGGGYGADGGNINISGGVVNVHIQDLGAGIGGGDGGAAGTIAISGGFVTAGSTNGAGIGCGQNGSGGTVTIESGSVNANSVLPAPTNDGTTLVYKSSITGMPNNTLLNYEIDRYLDADDDGSFNGSLSCISDGTGKIYLWLPLNEAKHTTVVAKDTTVTEGGSDNAYYAASAYVTTGTNNFTESSRSPSYVRASALALPESYIMNVNQTHTFYALAENCAYRGAVWTSDNTNVATVSKDGDGVVTTLSEGETTISATSYDGGFTASFVLTVDTTAPSGYTVSFNDSDGVYINKADVLSNSDFSFTISGAEVGSTLNYTVNKTDLVLNTNTNLYEEGATALYISGSIAVTSLMPPVSIGTLATDSSSDGKYTLSVTLTDANGNTGPAATDILTVDTILPATVFSDDYVIYAVGEPYVITSNNVGNIYGAISFMTCFEIGATLNYSFTDGVHTLAGSSIITTEWGYAFDGISLETLNDGDLTLSAALTDTAGNIGATLTYTFKKCTAAPDFSLSLGQTFINSSNADGLSFTVGDFVFKDHSTDYIANIREAVSSYSYTVSDGTNSISVAKTNFASTLTKYSDEAVVDGIDVSGLADGTLTLTVKIYNSYNDSTTKIATITKEALPPTVTLPPVSTAATSIGLNFSETVTAVEGKTVSVSDGTDTYTYTIALADNYLSGEGSSCKAAIPLTAFINGVSTLTLDSTKTYTVTVAAGAYKDAVGNELAYTELGTLSIVTAVQSVTVSGGSSVTNGGTLQLSAAVLPADAADTSVTWSVANGTGSATIDQNGLLTATAVGTVTVTATAHDGLGAYGTLVVTIMAPPSGGDSGGTGGTGNTGNTGNLVDTTTNNGTVIASTTIQGATGSNGIASASVTESQFAAALKKAAEEAKKQGAGSIELEIKVNTSGNVTGVSATIPLAAFNSAVSGGIDALTISSPAASISFNSAALSGIKANGTGDINISAVKVNVNELPQEDREKVGNRPVYDLTLTSGGTVISDFGGGTATVSVPYTPAAGEDPNKIVIYYISDSGEMIVVPDCAYDAATGMVTFATKHFSKYAVAYNDVSFSDVSGWSKEYVSYLAARGIINGTGEGTFSPDSNITRAEFVTILAKLSGNDLITYKASSFSDVAVTDWYSKYVQWALENGISKGTDGKFNPDEYISRQDIAVMIARYAEKVAKFTLPITNSAVTFTDGKEIDAYASDAVSAMQRAGIISGNSDGSFAPVANATRAEAAKMIAILMQEMI